MKVCSYNGVVNISKNNTAMTKNVVIPSFGRITKLPVNVDNAQKPVFGGLFSFIKKIFIPNKTVEDLSQLSFDELKKFSKSKRVKELDSCFYIRREENVLSDTRLKDGFYKILDKFFPKLDTIVEVKNAKIKQKVHFIPKSEIHVGSNAIVISFDEGGKYKITKFKRDGSKLVID